LSNKSLSGKVLVLGTDFKNYRSCLAIIRSLGRKGLHVDLAWNSVDDIARHSKYAAEIHDIPDFSPDEDSWKNKLIELIGHKRYDLVVPCNEQASAPLEANRTEFEKIPAVYLLNQRAYEIAFDKFKSNDLARSLGISVPQSRRIASIAEIDTILSEFQLPLVLKPSISFSLESLQRKNYVYKAYSKKELFTTLRFLLKSGAVLVQENFIGVGTGIGFIANHGELLYAFQHVRLHEPLMGGGSSYRKSAPCHPGLLDATSKLIKEMNYTGVGMAEYKVDFRSAQEPASDKWIFLEINGRFWGSLPLAVSAGADFPYFLYCLKTDTPLKLPAGYKTGIYARNTIRDFVWITENIFADKTEPSRNTVPNGTVALELLRFITFREKNDTWAIDDLTPGLLEFGRLFKIKMALVRRILMTLSPWRFIRSYRTRRALHRARSVLVVCFGNIYRSPFAERYLRKRLPESVIIHSAGYLPQSGRQCHERAIDIAAEFDIAMADHRSRIIAPEAVEKADIILTFDKENRKTLKNIFPVAAEKIFLLGMLSFTGPVYFEDPVEGNLYTIRNNYKAIKTAIDSFAEGYLR